MKVSSRGRVNDAGSCPAVGHWIVSPARVQNGTGPKSAPDDHFASGPNCRVTESGSRRVGDAAGSPTVGRWIVYSTGACLIGSTISTPHDHFSPRPSCRVNVSSGRRVGGARSRPTVGSGIVYPSGIQILRASTVIENSTPHNHLAARPDGRVKRARRRHAGRGGGIPTVCRRIVPPARVQARLTPRSSTPHNHCASGPDRRVNVSANRRVGGAGGCPTFGDGIVSTAGVRFAGPANSTPYNHLSTGPDSRVTVSATGRVGSCSIGPNIAGTGGGWRRRTAHRRCKGQKQQRQCAKEICPAIKSGLCDSWSGFFQVHVREKLVTSKSYGSASDSDREGAYFLRRNG